jgi:N-acetylglucosaminyldiphosphoundecaprenol N-acetyl-beta-D-mannosaminyltransferase
VSEGAVSGMETYEVLGIPVTVGDRESILARILDLCHRPEPAMVVPINPEVLVIAGRHPALSQVLKTTALNLVDGAGLAWLLSRYAGRKVERFPGVELVEMLARESARSGLRLGFAGGRSGSAGRARAALLAAHPGGDIWVGPPIQAPPRPSRDSEYAAVVRNAGVDVLLVALGAPKQELWLAENLAACGARVGVAVGGSFEILGGLVPRAPLWMRRSNLEWLYRTWREPSRLPRLIALARLPARVVRARVSGRAAVAQFLARDV